MAYDQYKLIVDVRMFLGGLPEDKIPDPTILYWGDYYDALPDYTGNYPYILWKTTLSCITYLKTKAVTSETSTKTSRSEKVGGVTISVSEDFGSLETYLDSLNDMWNDYFNHPERFGYYPETVGSIVIINGVNQDTVDNYRGNTSTTSIFSPLPVTAFPKDSDRVYRRNVNKRY